VTPLPPPVIKIIELPTPVKVVDVPVAVQSPNKRPTVVVTADPPILLLTKPGRKPSKLAIVQAVDQARPSTSAPLPSSPFDDPNLGSPVKERSILATYEAPNSPPVTHAKQVYIKERQRKRHSIREILHRLRVMLGMKRRKRTHRHGQAVENHLKPRKRDTARAKVPKRLWYVLIGRERTIIAMPMFQQAARASRTSAAQKKHRAALNRYSAGKDTSAGRIDHERSRGRQERDTVSEQRNRKRHRSPHAEQNAGRKIKSEIRQVARDANVAKNDILFHTTTGANTRNRYLKT